MNLKKIATMATEWARTLPSPLIWEVALSISLQHRLVPRNKHLSLFQGCNRSLSLHENCTCLRPTCPQYRSPALFAKISISWSERAPSWQTFHSTGADYMPRQECLKKKMVLAAMELIVPGLKSQRYDHCDQSHPGTASQCLCQPASTKPNETQKAGVKARGKRE